MCVYMMMCLSVVRSEVRNEEGREMDEREERGRRVKAERRHDGDGDGCVCALLKIWTMGRAEGGSANSKIARLTRPAVCSLALAWVLVLLNFET